MHQHNTSNDYIINLSVFKVNNAFTQVKYKINKTCFVIYNKNKINTDNIL